MSEKILIHLKERINELSEDKINNVEVLRNSLKEELQFYVLDFIYNHSKYNQWIMYGGSALRIIHKLNRMSIDLDFETSELITRKYLEQLKEDIYKYFSQNQALSLNFLNIKISGTRGLLLKFQFNEHLSINHPSQQIHLKIDLNHFIFNNDSIERQPVNKDQFSFIILSYNLPTLMASKLAAIFLRGTRGVAKNIYFEKGRDIYDLLWYMNQRIIPNFDYLSLKKLKFKDLDDLLKRLNKQISKVSDANLRDDLVPLFLNASFINNWLNNWKTSYDKLVEDYRTYRVLDLNRVYIEENKSTESYSFIFNYKTKEKKQATISYFIDEQLVRLYHKSSLKAEKLENRIIFSDSIKVRSQNKLKNIAYLLLQKNEDYLNKNKGKMLNSMDTNKISLPEKLISSQLVNLLK